MSHGKERKEKNCLNCGAQVQGFYCHICGQANVETHETLWDLITHFVYDITHFDGKFFSTLRYLLFKPGFLSAEYKRGRRATYLHPVRMYVFASALFFFIFFSFINSKDIVNVAASPKQLNELEKRIKAEIPSITDQVALYAKKDSLKMLDSLRKVNDAAVKLMWDDSALDTASNPDQLVLSFYPNFPRSLKEYDSLEAAKPAGKRHGWMAKYIIKSIIKINDKYKGQKELFNEKFLEHFIHSIPKMMFIGMPFIAAFLSLLYWRKKDYSYVNHGVLIIHVFVGIYMLILIVYCFGWLKDLSHWTIFSWLSSLTVIYIFYYSYKSLRNFYLQGRWKTVLKFSLLMLATTILFGVLAALFFVNSIISA